MQKQKVNEFVNRYKLYAQLKKSKMTQEDLADYLNVSRQSINSKLSGKSGFTEDQLVVLRVLFGNDIFLD